MGLPAPCPSTEHNEHLFLFQRLHQHSSMRMRRAASGNMNVVVRSQGDSQSLKCLAWTLWKLWPTGCHVKFYFSNFVCLIFKLCLWEAGRERLLYLKRQHLSLGNLGGVFRKEQTFIVLGRQLNPKWGPPLFQPILHTIQCTSFSSSFLQAPS